MKNNEVLYFEGAGCEDTNRGEINNCRIRTAFTNNENKKIYVEICGIEKTKDDLKKYHRFENYEVGEAIGFIDSCHYLTDDNKIDDCNESRLPCERKENISYSHKGILDFINKNCNCSFDSIEDLGWLAGYRVFADETKDTSNTHKAFNYGDEFQYNSTLENTRKEIQKHFYDLEKSEGKKYPNFSLWVDDKDFNLLHLLRHYNGYNKHWSIRTDIKNWKENIQETKLGKYAC
ncbi:hypothetical protein [Clostridium estertheticum]|uniref:hypothetical protein n=1 Tax=Clostridium estertheticum TaxID=238834 RepID=UPI001C0D2BE6|nr:hypothetical protein [Clostridium estertheticum]MBU3186615.1 hypothetical protein [Clostridium estertheticum]